MYAGKIVESGQVEPLYEKPLHPYTVSLLSAVPVPDPAVKRSRIVLTGEVPSPLKPPPGCRFHPRCPHPLKDTRCTTDPPELREVHPGRWAACHYADSPMEKAPT